MNAYRLPSGEFLVPRRAANARVVGDGLVRVPADDAEALAWLEWHLGRGQTVPLASREMVQEFTTPTVAAFTLDFDGILRAGGAAFDASTDTVAALRDYARHGIPLPLSGDTADFAARLPGRYEEGKHPRGYGGRWRTANVAHQQAEEVLQAHEKALGKSAEKVEKLRQAHETAKAAHAVAKKQSSAAAATAAGLATHQAHLAAIKAKGQWETAKAAHGALRKIHGAAKKEHAATARELKAAEKERDRKPAKSRAKAPAKPAASPTPAASAPAPAAAAAPAVSPPAATWQPVPERPQPAAVAPATPGILKVNPDPGLSPAALAALKGIAGNIASNPDLSREQRVEFFQASQRVLKNMSPAALERFRAGSTGGVHFAPSLDAMAVKAVHWAKSDPGERQQDLAKVRGLGAGGIFGRRYATGGGVEGGVFVDGGRLAAAGARAAAAGRAVGPHQIYAHEFAHAIDGAQGRLSKQPPWQAAWQAELAGGQLTAYAGSVATEGWAEFGRLVLGGDHDLADVARSYPRCWAVWQSHGLVGTPGAGQPARFADEPEDFALTGGIDLPELFGERVPLDDDGAHADLLLDDQENSGAARTPDPWDVYEERARRRGDAGFATGLPGAYTEGKHPRGYGGKWAKKGGIAEKEKEEKDKAPAPREWDGTIDADEVDRDSYGHDRVTTWDYYDDEGNQYTQQILLVHGTYDPFPETNEGEAVDVYRWESWDEGAGETDHGDWTTDEQEAVNGGERFARNSDQEPPEEQEEEEEPDEEEEDDTEEDWDEVDTREWAEEVYGSMDDGDVLALLGTPVGSVLYKRTDVGRWKGHYSDDVPLQAYGIEVEVRHPKLKSFRRFLGVDAQGAQFVKNDLIEVQPEYKSEGLGADIFAAQVEEMARQGFAYIQCHAAGDYDSAQSPNGMNGYYTWPRFGYDQDLDSIRRTNRDLADKIEHKFPAAESVLDVFASKEGRDWWLHEGNDLYDARFDLSEGSRSREVLEAYLMERRAKGKGKKS